MNTLARVLIGLAITTPWLALVPWESRIAVVVTTSLALVAAFHGAGRLVAKLARTDVDTALAIQWGIAAMITLGGLAILFRVAYSSTHHALVFGGIAVHSIMLVRQHAPRSARLAERLGGPDRRFWLLPATLVLGLSVFYLLGTAGDLGGRPFDDDGNYLAQIKRLHDTGTLADPVGFFRGSQLGGQLTVSALATVTGDHGLARWVDHGLGFTLVLLLVVTRIRPRDGATALWALLIVLIIAAIPLDVSDPAPRWTATGLVLALFITLDEHAAHGGTLAFALLAGAVATLRSELVPIAVASVAGAWWLGGRSKRADLSRIAQLLGVPLLVVLPYVVTCALAWSSVPAASTLFADAEANRWLHVAAFAGVFVASLAVLSLAADRELRWQAIATCAGIAGIVSELTGDRPYATRFAWPIAIAFGAMLVIDVCRRPQRRTIALVLSLLGCILVFDGRHAGGRVRWSRRLTNLASNIEYLRHDAALTGGYEEVLANIPEGAAVAIWIDRPELLDYSAHQYFDLRTPRGARLRTHSWAPHASRIEALLAGAGARYLLLEADLRHLARTRRDPAARLACTVPHPACADDLEVIALRYPVTASVKGVRLIELTAPRQ